MSNDHARWEDFAGAYVLGAMAVGGRRLDGGQGRGTRGMEDGPGRSHEKGRSHKPAEASETSQAQHTRTVPPYKRHTTKRFLSRHEARTMI